MHKRMSWSLLLFVTTWVGWHWFMDSSPAASRSTLQASESNPPSPPQDAFEKKIKPIFERSCAACHGAEKQKGHVRLDTFEAVVQSQKRKPILVAGESAKSLIHQRITSDDPNERMPPTGPPLKDEEITIIKQWIEHDLINDEQFQAAPSRDSKPWSWQPLKPVALPTLANEDQRWVRNPIDQFILHTLRAKGLQPSKEAERRVLLRRLYFDLIGLPPTPEEVEAFLNDSDPRAYEKRVDTLLASVHYGERWARHWLDVVHYADSHGYDKDKPRPHAWPYRDYVIRAFNEDKPYTRFVREQLAGDLLYPFERDGIEATGFLSAGPWDFIGHEELPETKIDGMVARHLDRDDMVANAIGTFMSLTIHCAQCHNHKFDPITQEDYYRLQAVFAALDRADFEYDTDSEAARRRDELRKEQRRQTERRTTLNQHIRRRDQDNALAALERKMTHPQDRPQVHPPEFGYHSALAKDASQAKWAQIDLLDAYSIRQVVLIGCFDDFQKIGAGFGFPRQFKIEASLDPEFKTQVHLIHASGPSPMPNPGTHPQIFKVDDVMARYVRVTATQLAHRHDAYMFALAEVEVYDDQKSNVAKLKPVSSLDAIETLPRWSKAHLTDGLYPSPLSSTQQQREEAKREFDRLWQQLTTPEEKNALAELDHAEIILKEVWNRLPPVQKVYRGCVHEGKGHFKGTGAQGGKPRPIFLLQRGDVLKPLKEMSPGAIASLPISMKPFALAAEHQEGERRAALAEWITDPQNPLTWRSIVNRIWLYHFGRGLVDTPNDFGRMGQLPTHPELLDWLALEFRHHGQSIKALHRLIVTSATYRQASAYDSPQSTIDANNQYYWRMNRRRLEAEAIRDSLLAASGKLHLKPFGPPFQDFVVDKSEHSPHYEYHLADHDRPDLHRRTIYRFIVRSHLHPFLTTFDCADPSIAVDKRNQTFTPQQALSLMNNALSLRMAHHFAERLKSHSSELDQQVRQACKLALAREPDDQELVWLSDHAREHGLASMCRVLFNLNEFIFID